MRSPVAAMMSALYLWVAGCTDEARAPEPAPVEIAAIYNQTGGQAQLDLASLDGARLAVAEANRDGGVLGRPVALITGDGGSDPARVAASAEAVIAAHPRVAAFMGLSDTDQVLAAAPVAAKAGRVFLTSGATSPKLPAAVPGYLFLACFGDNVQAAAAAEWAYGDREARKVAILANGSMSYTRLLRDYFVTRFTELGGRVVSEETYGPGGLEAAVQRLKRADIVFAPVAPEEVIDAVRALRRAGYRGPVLGGDGYDLGAAWGQGSDLGGIYFTTHAYLGPDNRDPLVQAFRANYALAYPGADPDAFSALGYDAARLLIAAVGSAGTDDPAKLAAALAKTRDFAGVSGTITYADGSRIPSKSVSIIGVDGGRQSFLRQLTPERVPAP